MQREKSVQESNLIPTQSIEKSPSVEKRERIYAREPLHHKMGKKIVECTKLQHFNVNQRETRHHNDSRKGFFMGRQNAALPAHHSVKREHIFPTLYEIFRIRSTRGYRTLLSRGMCIFGCVHIPSWVAPRDDKKICIFN